MQAMVHELIGIEGNRVDLRSVPGIKPEFAEAVLSAHQDPFFRVNMCAAAAGCRGLWQGCAERTWAGEGAAAAARGRSPAQACSLRRMACRAPCSPSLHTMRFTYFLLPTGTPTLGTWAWR